VTEEDFQTFDFLLAMDTSNLEDLEEIVETVDKKERGTLGKGKRIYALLISSTIVWRFSRVRFES
jgi:protein-tyrosine-phosphatase